ncbi:protein phosphatase [Megamonas funiformis]|uniref:protein phosphatase n=1 Tax=Megamonas funiformis TaxID=437897 RepID=UPI0022E86ABC|nr:protein phosphatase [Megamonas funiformis]
MRKINSTFKTAFISEAGAALKNNDYFAYVELDDYACYVIANSITDRIESESAKVAVENAIRHFQENPSMRRRAMQSYLKATNEDFLSANSNEKLKASICIVVTDYEKLRFGIAGNTRFRLYREGIVAFASHDMSLTQDLIEDEKLPENILSKHEERHNLYTYLGQEKDFSPYISQSIKLINGDIVSLYTSGIWENIDEGELDDVFSEAGDEPQPILDEVEDLLLSRQPKNLTNYTIATIFIDKIFTDPNRARRIRRMIRIAIIVFIILLILGIIFYIWYSNRQDKKHKMNLYTDNTVTAIQDNNYIRAQSEVKKGIDLAENLDDEERINLLNNYSRLIDAVIAADNDYKNEKYTDAYEAYQNALDISRYADNLGESYINKQIMQCENYLSVSDLIALGDKALEENDFDKAEKNYFEAKKMALKAHDLNGNQQAKEALEKLYEQKKQMQDEQDKKDKQKLSEDISDLITQGDNLQQGGDYVGAEAKYMEAKELAAKNYDADSKKEALSALEKLDEVKAKAEAQRQKNIDEQSEKYMTAALVLARGDDAFSAGDYTNANAYYNTALEQYTSLGDNSMCQSISFKLQQVATKQQEISNQIQSAANLMMQADGLYKQNEYNSAKQLYLKAKQEYQSLGREDKVDEINNILDQIDIDMAVMETMPQ